MYITKHSVPLQRLCNYYSSACHEGPRVCNLHRRRMHGHPFVGAFASASLVENQSCGTAVYVSSLVSHSRHGVACFSTGAEFGANPRSYYERAIRCGLLTINGKNTSPDYKLNNSDLVCNRQAGEEYVLLCVLRGALGYVHM